MTQVAMHIHGSQSARGLVETRTPRAALNHVQRDGKYVTNDRHQWRAGSTANTELWGPRQTGYMRRRRLARDLVINNKQPRPQQDNNKSSERPWQSQQQRRSTR